MADITALGSILNKAANTGSSTSPDNIEIVMEALLTIDDTTKVPTGVIINVERLFQGADEYLADSASISDGIVAIELAKKV